MAGNLLDHFIFKSRKFTPKAKAIIFTIIAASIIGVFFYFKDCAWGIDGTASIEMKGRKWRKVSDHFSPLHRIFDI
jgi:dolichyl-phosphate-mannose-protein mannosyltransferase